MVDWVPVRGERDSRYGEGWVLKQALEVIAPAVARQSSLAIVEAWIENCAPVTDFQNPRDVIRLARIYAMALVPDQLWELRFISEHPERSMVLVTILDGMPPRGTLERFVEPADWDERVYVIAARKPNWRALWRGQLWDW